MLFHVGGDGCDQGRIRGGEGEGAGV